MYCILYQKVVLAKFIYVFIIILYNRGVPSRESKGEYALDEIRNTMFLPLMKKALMRAKGGRPKLVFLKYNIFCPYP